MHLDRVFEALASSPRRQILAYLSEARLSTTDLAQRFAMSAPAISRHLSILENAGLVTREREGQFVYYQPRQHADGLCLRGLPGCRAAQARVARTEKKQHRIIS